MADVKLLINGKEYPIYYNVISAISESITDDEHYKDLACALASLNIPSVTEQIAEMDHLDRKERDALWAQGDIQIQRALLKGTDFRADLSDEQAADILRLDDLDMLVILAYFIEDFSEEDGTTRLSEEMADKIIKHIKNCPYQLVKTALMENEDCPKDLKVSFTEAAEKGLDMENYSFDEFRSADLKCLEKCNRDILKALAENVSAIPSKKTMLNAANFLAEYPDPEVRIALADNCRLKEILKILSSDPDKDVAQAAKDAAEFYDEME